MMDVGGAGPKGRRWLAGKSQKQASGKYFPSRLERTSSSGPALNTPGGKDGTERLRRETRVQSYHPRPGALIVDLKQARQVLSGSFPPR